MRISQWGVIVVACVVGLPILAAAQTPQGTTPQTTTGTPILERIDSHWLASGFVGSSFGNEAADPSVDFGGTVGYLWRGIVGGEFQANFSPEFTLEEPRSALLLGAKPWINSYMANAIGALPLGEEGRWHPYVSGGLGALTLRSDMLATDQGEIDPDDRRLGRNFGFGIMGFLRNWGLRGDVRYFRGFESDIIGARLVEGNFDPGAIPADEIGDQVLEQLVFWRANVGLAVRW